MPVNFLTTEQRKCYGHYLGPPLFQQLERYFFLDDVDKELINQCRTEHSRLGFAAQLGTARFLGTFLDDLREIPENVLLYLANQLGIENPASLHDIFLRG